MMTEGAPNLWGVGCTSLGAFIDEYRVWWHRRNERRKNPRQFPTLVYSSFFANTLRPVELYLVETIAVFVQLRNLLPPGSTVVVADAPLLLSEIPSLQPLDWDQDAFRYRFHAIDLLHFEEQRLAALANPQPDAWVQHTPQSLDRLGLVIDETANGTLLTPLNSITHNLDNIPRAKLKQAMARYLQRQLDLGQFEQAARQVIKSSGGGETQLLLAHLKALLEQLGRSQGLYQEVVSSLIAKRSITRLIKDTAITSFEAQFLYRLAGSVNRVEKRAAAREEAHQEVG